MLSITKVKLEELSDLHQICITTYPIYFSDYWIGPGLKLYLDEQFGTMRLKSDLTNNSIDYFFIQQNSEPIGFIKINYEASFNNHNKRTTCELEKMYIIPEYKGKGIGRIILNELIDKVRLKVKKIFFLYVLDTNLQTIKFYENIGFKFHEKTWLTYEHFKKELKGLNRMYLEL